jgi:hypothetical protein
MKKDIVVVEALLLDCTEKLRRRLVKVVTVIKNDKKAINIHQTSHVYSSDI